MRVHGIRLTGDTKGIYTLEWKAEVDGEWRDMFIVLSPEQTTAVMTSDDPMGVAINIVYKFHMGGTDEAV